MVVVMAIHAKAAGGIAGNTGALSYLLYVYKIRKKSSIFDEFMSKIAETAFLDTILAKNQRREREYLQS